MSFLRIAATIAVIALTAVAGAAVSAWAQAPSLPVSPAAQAAPVEPPDALGLDEVMTLALSHDPAVAAARLRRAIDEAQLGVAREIPNPELRYEREKEAPHDSLAAAQLLEWPGKRGRRVDVARAAIRTGEAELAQAEAAARADAARAFYTLTNAARRAALTEELRALAARAREAASQRLQVGDVSRLDLLQAELALAQAENDASAVEGETAGARADLNTRIGREPGAPTHVRDEIVTAPPADPAALATMATGSAALVVLDRQIAEQEAKLALARVSRMPDPTVEGTVTHDAPGEFQWGWRAAVAVAVPLFTRHNAGVRVEEATLAQLRAQRSLQVLRVQGGIYAAAVRAAAARDQYLRYVNEILPKSREVEAMAQESYREGQTNLTALLQSLQEARELRLRALQAAADIQNALADLRQAMTVGPK